MKQGKYDTITMPIRVNGILIGNFVQKRTAKEAWEDRIAFAEFRRLFNEAIKNSKFKTPIFGEE